MLREISIRQRVILCTFIPGGVFVAISLSALLGVSGSVLTVFGVVTVACMVAGLLLLHFSPLEKHDEMTRDVLGKAADRAMLWDYVGVCMMIGVCHYMPFISAEVALEMVLAILFLAPGINFLILMGREDAYLDD